MKNKIKFSSIINALLIIALVASFLLGGVVFGKYVQNFNAGGFKFKAIPATEGINEVYTSYGIGYRFEYTVVQSGYYQLQAWGGSGGDCRTNYETGQSNSTWSDAQGGNGGYASGVFYLDAGQELYIYLGGEGESTDSTVYGNGMLPAKTYGGGYNGGGSAISDGTTNHVFGAGGGATHISTEDSMLFQLANNKDSVLIVAGGGGGARDQANNWSNQAATVHATRYGHGGAGGGENGVAAIGLFREAVGSSTALSVSGVAGTQTTGYMFGRGENATNNGGGGGGWYGGYSGAPEKMGNAFAGAGSGGSGYVREDAKNPVLINGNTSMPNHGTGSSSSSSAGISGTNRDNISSLSSLIKYDGAVAVFLNGTEIMRHNIIPDVAKSPLEWKFASTDSTCIDSNYAITVENIDTSLLKNGTNVLSAIVYDVRDDVDSFFSATLTGKTSTGASIKLVEDGVSNWTWGKTWVDMINIGENFHYWSTADGWSRGGYYLWTVFPATSHGATRGSGVAPLGFAEEKTTTHGWFKDLIKTEVYNPPAGDTNEYCATLYRTEFEMYTSTGESTGDQIIGNDGRGVAKITYLPNYTP